MVRRLGKMLLATAVGVAAVTVLAHFVLSETWSQVIGTGVLFWLVFSAIGAFQVRRGKR